MCEGKYQVKEVIVSFSNPWLFRSTWLLLLQGLLWGSSCWRTSMQLLLCQCALVSTMMARCLNRTIFTILSSKQFHLIFLCLDRQIFTRFPQVLRMNWACGWILECLAVSPTLSKLRRTRTDCRDIPRWKGNWSRFQPVGTERWGGGGGDRASWLAQLCWAKGKHGWRGGGNIDQLTWNLLML